MGRALCATRPAGATRHFVELNRGESEVSESFRKSAWQASERATLPARRTTRRNGFVSFFPCSEALKIPEQSCRFLKIAEDFRWLRLGLLRAREMKQIGFVPRARTEAN
jgi:hypothetical protein